MSNGFSLTQEGHLLPQKAAQKPADHAARGHRADISREADRGASGKDGRRDG